MGRAFTAKGLDSPRLSAEMLVAHVLKCERLRLYMEADRPASPEELATLRDLTGRALKHEPVQYLTGEAWFYGLPFKADRRALIPRPATQTLVESGIHHLRAEVNTEGSPTAPVLDLCTGTGCVAIALAKQVPNRAIVATDLSSEALTLAMENAAQHEVTDRIEFRQGDLFNAVDPSARFAAILSNPPYIPDHEWAAVEPNVKDHEPTLALRGGADGLDLVRPIIAGAPERLQPGGLLAIEVATSTTEQTKALFEQQGELRDIRVLTDFEGLPRVVVGIKVGNGA
jgi:release factor glutamine methyltransferase